MQAPSWIALMKLIPTNLHDTLVLITSTGIEVMVQRLLRLEQDYMVFRGRTAGTLDSGRVMIMPFDQISNVAFNKRLTEPEVNEIFGNSGGAVSHAGDPERPEQLGDAGDAQNGMLAEDANAGAKEPAPVGPAPMAPDAAAPVAAPVKPDQASKSALLARLRARLAGSAKKG